MKMSILTFSFILGLFPVLPGLSAERIISLKPNVTEILFSLGKGDEIVGVTRYCELPVGERKREIVATYMNIDVEKVVLLSPTIVMGSKENSSEKEIEFLRARGFRVILLPFRTLEETFSSMTEMGRALGVEEEGKRVVSGFQSALETLKPKSPRPLQRDSVLGVVGMKPLVIVGSDNLIDDLFHLMGVKNVAGETPLSYPVWSIEQMISRRPDIVIDLTMGSEANRRDRSLEWYRQFSSVPAVRDHRIFFLDMGDFRASPRLVNGARKLHGIFSGAPHS